MPNTTASALCAITTTLCLVAATHAQTDASPPSDGIDMSVLRADPAFASCKAQAKEKMFKVRDERRAFLAKCVAAADAKATQEPATHTPAKPAAPPATTPEPKK